MSSGPVPGDAGAARRLRVLFLVHEFPVLSQTFVVNQAVGVLKAGHDLTIGTLVDAPIPSARHADVDRWSLLDRVCRPAPVPGPLAHRLRTGLQLLWSGGRRGLVRRLYHVNPLRHGRDALNLRRLHQVGNLSALTDFDIVHAQFGTVALDALMLRKAGFLGGRLVTTFRGYDISSVLVRHGHDLYGELFRKGDWFLTNCDFFRDRLIGLGCPSDRLSVLPSGLDAARFPLEDRAPWGGSRHVELLFVGRLVAKKGADDALRAVAAANRAGHAIRLTLAGDGDLRGSLIRLAETLGIAALVRFIGECTETQIANLLARSDLFIAPSKTAADGDQDAPTNVLKEAMASGLPVLATRHGGIPELVEHGVTGYLCAEGDAAGLGDNLLQLLRHPENWPGMGRAGRARVIQDYDLAGLNRQLCSHYAQVLRLPCREAKPNPEPVGQELAPGRTCQG